MAYDPLVYDQPLPSTIECDVRGQATLPWAVVELHQYRFRGPQRSIFRSSRGFLDLALSPRPGKARGGFVDGAPQAPRAFGDIIFVPAARELDAEWGEGEQCSVCCRFEPRVASEDDVVFDADQLEACLDVSSPTLRGAFLRLAQELKTPGFSSELLIEALLSELAIELGRYLRRDRARQADGAGLMSSSQLRMIEDILRQPGPRPPVLALAKACGVSTRQFFRMFRASTGRTLTAYAAEMRLAHAKALLATRVPPIKEIAWRCGFDTSAAFAAAFRAATGLTPKAYRRARTN